MEMNLFVLNLPRSRLRHKLIANRLASLGISFSTFPASFGSSLNRFQYDRSDSLSDGELGCAVSHYLLYQKISANQLGLACILEDDVRPTKKLRMVLGYFETNPPPDGVVVLLNAAFTHVHDIVLRQCISSGITIGIVQALPGGLGSTGGYILNAKTAESLATARHSDWSFAADSWTHYYRCGALKEIWIVLPYPAPPSFRTESTIGYPSQQTNSLHAIKAWPFFGLIRNLNRRRVWLSKQLPMRFVNHSYKKPAFNITFVLIPSLPRSIMNSFISFAEKLFIAPQALLVKAGLFRSITCSAGRILIRRNTSDLTCFRQVFIQQEYAMIFPLRISSIVDLGANSGMFCRYIKSRFPSARLIAVEPEPQNFKALQSNLAHLESTSAINVAIWSEEAEMLTQFKPGGEWGAKTTPLTSSRRDHCSQNLGIVPGMTLEMLMKNTGLSTIDLLKVDIEGAELELFKGDCSWLKNVGVIAIELHDWITPGCSKAVCTSLSRYLQNFSFSWLGENLIIFNNDYISSSQRDS